MRIGLRGRSPAASVAPRRNLVFLVDLSGSMDEPDKLPLVKQALGLLADRLTASDSIAIVTYAGAERVALAPTSGADKAAIHAALDSLGAEGSTNGEAGIRKAYDLAAENLLLGGVNRVILATDGDFNVGVSSESELVRLIETQRERGIFLTVLGVGTDNLQDGTMQALADRGNGNHAYLDSIREAEKVLVRELGATLDTIAKDVKIQVEFNPAEIEEYRLVGYENRLLAPEDFDDDTKDAGEMGAGHVVTALYELVPSGGVVRARSREPLKYQVQRTLSSVAGRGEIATVKLRYKLPAGRKSQLFDVPVLARDLGATGSEDLRFSAAVALYGLMLRDSGEKGVGTWSLVHDLAAGSLGPDPDGDRAEFLALVAKAEALATPQGAALTR